MLVQQTSKIQGVTFLDKWSFVMFPVETSETNADFSKTLGFLLKQRCVILGFSLRSRSVVCFFNEFMLESTKNPSISLKSTDFMWIQWISCGFSGNPQTTKTGVHEV